ncbi:MAG: chorismate mutase [Opitutae bacterium]|nr:chorismate mutase [Opitutae bacterium]
MSKLQQWRNKIDGLDRRLVALLNQRLATVSEIARWKAENKIAAYSPSRTAEIMHNIAAANRGPHSVAQLRRIYRQVIAASVDLQKKTRPLKRK